MPGIAERKGLDMGKVYCPSCKLMPPYYPEYAAMRFGEDLPDWVFQELPFEERKARMEAHAAAIPADDVICSCMGCLVGIAVGGKRPAHILEPVFGTSR
jgi:hypothetical protein